MGQVGAPESADFLDGKERRIEPDAQERLLATVSGPLQEVVRDALKQPGAILGTWNLAPLSGGVGTLAGRSRVYRLMGTATVGANKRPWSVVLKVLAPAPDQDDPTHIRYWKRELLLHTSGLLDALPAGLSAPRCYAGEELDDGTAWLWLEDIREDGKRSWPLARWALAARHLGQFNGSFLDGRPLPTVSWLGGRRLRTWLETHGPLVARIETAPRKPELRRWWPRSVVDAIIRVWDEREAFCTALERLPQTFCHGDAIRRNLISRHRSNGSEETVGIDWEHAGLYAVGEEVGQTLSVASAFYDVDPADLPALDEMLFTGYLAGLGDAGWSSDPRPVRFAYATHAALRNLFNAVGASVPDEARRVATVQNQGHTWEDLAERRAMIRPFLLDRAAEARELLSSL